MKVVFEVLSKYVHRYKNPNLLILFLILITLFSSPSSFQSDSPLFTFNWLNYLILRLFLPSSVTPSQLMNCHIDMEIFLLRRKIGCDSSERINFFQASAHVKQSFISNLWATIIKLIIIQSNNSP